MKTLLIFCFLQFVLIQNSFPFSDEELAQAIFKAEGGFKARYLFGIKSVKYKNLEDAKKICLNTIRNNRRRFKDYGYKQYKTFLEFLASRYAPKDAHPKNKHWLKNVRYFLEVQNAKL